MKRGGLGNVTKRKLHIRKGIHNYRCMKCGYVYAPLKPNGTVPAGIRFESLGDDWCCPVCGSGKTQFTRIA